MSDKPDRTVYRTSAESMLALWDKWRLANDEFNAAIAAFLDTHAPSGAKAMTVNAFGARKLVGITVEGNWRQPPDGWRIDRKRWIFVPFRTKAQGKIVARALDAVVLPDFRAELVGMPSWDFQGMGLRHPGVEMHGGAMYVIWSGEGPQTGIDGDLWEPVKLSEYYAVVEAEKASKRPTGGTDG